MNIDTGGVIPVMLAIATILGIALLIVTFIKIPAWGQKIIWGLGAFGCVVVLLRFFGVHIY